MNLEPLFEWVTKREAIRMRKEAGDPPPWTGDPILAAYRFCNVRREDDRVTRWIDERIRVPFADHPLLWLMLCVARQVNWPPTLSALMIPAAGAWPSHELFEPRRINWVLDALAGAGLKVFTGAYIITAPQERGARKTTFVAECVIGPLWRNRDRIGDAFRGGSMRAAHVTLMEYEGWGPFLAYQAIVDMRFCPSLLMNATDRDTWAAAGPGTIRGLNRVHGRPVGAGLSQGQALQEILAIYPTIKANTGVGVDLSDVPNVLCEVDKYLRVRNGEGTPRARYVPGRGS